MKKSTCLGAFKRGGSLGIFLGLALLSPALAQIYYYPRAVSPLSIVSPANLSIFYAPVDIPIFAYARDGLGSVGPVRFYADTNFLGDGQKLHIATPFNALPIYQFGRDQ